MTPKTKRAVSITGLVAFLITVLGFAGGAATGFFKAGAVVQAVESEVASHEKRIVALEVRIDAKADKSDVEASERRVTKHIDDAVEVLRADIRELRARP